LALTLRARASAPRIVCFGSTPAGRADRRRPPKGGFRALRLSADRFASGVDVVQLRWTESTQLHGPREARERAKRAVNPAWRAGGGDRIRSVRHWLRASHASYLDRHGHVDVDGSVSHASP
jgi:hypothetical protein